MHFEHTHWSATIILYQISVPCLYKISHCSCYTENIRTMFSKYGNKWKPQQQLYIYTAIILYTHATVTDIKSKHYVYKKFS